MTIWLNAPDAGVYARHCRSPDAGAFDAVLDLVHCVCACVPEVTVSAIDGLAGVETAVRRSIAEELGVMSAGAYWARSDDYAFRL